MFGNLLGASGVLDMIIALLSMEYNLVPPTLNLNAPVLNGINYVAKDAKEYKVGKSLVISRGRGGINSVLVVEKHPAP
jgi:3-oxoacyl-(acyl-carrier-protein) synthase